MMMLMNSADDDNDFCPSSTVKFCMSHYSVDICIWCVPTDGLWQQGLGAAAAVL